MQKQQDDGWDGRERRSRKDRREGDRRVPERQEPAGVLTTRKGERRRKGRRAEDQQENDDTRK